MKKIALICLVLFLSGCIKYDIEEIRPNEMGIDNSFSGKIFELECSAILKDAKGANRSCREHIAEFAHQNGYSYFSVLSSDVNSQSLRQGTITAVPIKTQYNNGVVLSDEYTLGDGDASNEGVSAGITTYIPQTNVYQKGSSAYLFVLIEPNDINNWKNYYKVSDYFSQKKEASRVERTRR